ncbi:transglutaminase family protein [Zhongshania aquimaris]|uniref:Transglutaminase family protein n=1 Tax=Zhongshania aquimaris TaxID=2857107 RepID=A0ABS6VTZ6_9GAMM|nr:transglutaminase family protein [Zhongshania aquimaris]MBW2941794.1 transglutaminase family protein [Zhongshania aquimaris]
MQRYKILHRTYYNFSSAVTLGPHFLRLRPREDYELRLESFSLNITPSATLLWHRDAEGNSVATATFDLATQQLVFESELIIQQYNEAPLNFMVADYAVHYPFNYTQDDQVLLSPYMQLPDQDTQQQIKQWTQQLWQAGEKIQTYTALQRIASHIFKNFTYKLREEPGVQTAKETLACNTGSCRDFAQLFMDAAKCMGLAARFVTGYLHAPGLDAAGATHAWAEVYLPGAGWKGFDPTIGAMAGTDHIPVAVARLSKSVPPIAGSFIGEPKSTLDVGVWVSKLA